MSNTRTWNENNGESAGSTGTDTETAEEIVMYGADWCGDCIRAKRWFDDNGVDYTYVNLEETPDAVDVVLERNKGVQRIPVIVFPDDSHLTEPSNDALADKMAALNTGT